MCKTPKMPAPAEPVAPTAPVATPNPLAIADGETKRPLGLAQLRTGTRSLTNQSAAGSTGLAISPGQ